MEYVSIESVRSDKWVKLSPIRLRSITIATLNWYFTRVSVFNADFITWFIEVYYCNIAKLHNSGLFCLSETIDLYHAKNILTHTVLPPEQHLSESQINVVLQRNRSMEVTLWEGILYIYFILRRFATHYAMNISWFLRWGDT